MQRWICQNRLCFEMSGCQEKKSTAVGIGSKNKNGVKNKHTDLYLEDSYTAPSRDASRFYQDCTHSPRCKYYSKNENDMYLIPSDLWMKILQKY